MKKDFLIYKLHFTTPLHLGDARDDYSISLKSVASDTMYAALTSSLAKIGKAIPPNGDLGFTISSLFPFYQKDTKSNTVLFFPRPYKKININIEDPLVNAKMIKRIAWLDVDYFNKVINNEDIFLEHASLNTEYLTDKVIDEKFIMSDVSPRVKVPRDYSVIKDATPFYMDRIYFKDYSGLYFIVSGDVNLLNTALDILQYEGIGTDRNVGNGQFIYDTDHIVIDLPIEKDTQFALSLSMFIPESKKQLKTMLTGENVGYDLARRGGWITTPPFNTYRKNAIYAFTHGSVFSKKMVNTVEIMGKIVDLSPDKEDVVDVGHSIWRNGKSFFVPIVV
jgi:CRISPR type III-A-associated RAMP protein Csm4